MMTEQEIWDLVLANEKLLRREVKRYVPHNRREQDLDEVYSDVVYGRAHAIMATYDPARGVLPITHLCANVRWYAYERVLGRKYKRVPDPVDMTGDHSHEPHRNGSNGHSCQVLAAELQDILDKLPVDARNVLVWRFIRDLTVDEIAKHWECRRRVVEDTIAEALQMARDLNVHGRIATWLKELDDALLPSGGPESEAERPVPQDEGVEERESPAVRGNGGGDADGAPMQI